MSDKKHETLQIEGMSCGHCVKAVQGTLEDLGVVEVHAVEIGSAQISYDPAATDSAGIVDAIEEAGYTVLATA